MTTVPVNPTNQAPAVRFVKLAGVRVSVLFAAHLANPPDAVFKLLNVALYVVRVPGVRSRSIGRTVRLTVTVTVSVARSPVVMVVGRVVLIVDPVAREKIGATAGATSKDAVPAVLTFPAPSVAQKVTVTVIGAGVLLRGAITS